ncbi:uncharacterized protein PAC_02485 [Phialocephala subalpina]|uniref:Uncharacterized protein n=1 Tax=Phialocephala subalpina TaxID=576137 RepID=A0A1L7WIN5_9HELO|nr:uncharacterized protein PAC_02485 [Phialocephala subalpina]
MATKTNKKVVLVTGSNQGLGFEIIHVLALREPDSIYMLCSRDLVKGQEALGKLRELGVKSEIEVLKFDVTDDSDIQSAVDFVSGNVGAKVGLNGVTAHMQAGENDRCGVFWKEDGEVKGWGKVEEEKKEGYVRFYVAQPGILKTAFNGFRDGAKSPELGAEVIARLAGENDRCGVFWKEDGEVKGWGKVEEEKKEGYVRFYVAQPGILKTAFNGFRDGAKSPELGAEVIARLVVDGQGGKYYPGGTYWKCDVDVMEEVPW